MLRCRRGALTGVKVDRCGLGQGLFLVPTLFYATRDLKPEHGTTAAALFNLSGSLDGPSALASSAR